MSVDRIDFGPRQVKRPTIERVDSGRQRVLETILALRIADTVREVRETGAPVQKDHIVAAIQYACLDHGIVLTEESAVVS